MVNHEGVDFPVEHQILVAVRQSNRTLLQNIARVLKEQSAAFETPVSPDEFLTPPHLLSNGSSVVLTNRMVLGTNVMRVVPVVRGGVLHDIVVLHDTDALYGQEVDYPTEEEHLEILRQLNVLRQKNDEYFDQKVHCMLYLKSPIEGYTYANQANAEPPADFEDTGPTPLVGDFDDPQKDDSLMEGGPTPLSEPLVRNTQLASWPRPVLVSSQDGPTAL